MTAFFGFENLWLDVEPHFNICLNVKLNFVCVNSDIDRRKVHKIPSPNQIGQQTMLSNKHCLKNQPKLKFFLLKKLQTKSIWKICQSVTSNSQIQMWSGDLCVTLLSISKSSRKIEFSEHQKANYCVPYLHKIVFNIMKYVGIFPYLHSNLKYTIFAESERIMELCTVHSWGVKLNFGSGIWSWIFSGLKSCLKLMLF